jgi:hypothetical protein
MEPVAPVHSDSFYLGRLQNGVTVTVPDLSPNNNSYLLDPYYTFELPTGATSLSIALTADSAANFQIADGWLMVRRGDRPSSNDTDMTENDYVSETPNDSNIYAVGVPDGTAGLAPDVIRAHSHPVYNGDLGGEWFVSLDVSSSNVMTGMSIIASWNDPPQMPANAQAINGNNGSLQDGADFLFNIPAAGDGPTSVWWTVDVPSGYTLGVVLDDNANGDITAQLSSDNVALILSINEPFSASFDPSNVLALLTEAVPYGGVYYNAGSDLTVYISAASYSTEEFDNVRLLLTVTQASYVTMNAAGGAPTPSPSPSPSPSGGWLDMTTILGQDAGVPLNQMVDDWDNATSLTYSNQPPSYIADASIIWDNVESYIAPIINTIPGPVSPAKIYARIASVTPNTTVVSQNLSGEETGQVVTAVWGYQPFQYSVSTNYTAVLNSLDFTGQLSVENFPAVLYFREVVILNFTPVDDPEANQSVDPTQSKSFVEMAVLFDPTTAASIGASNTLFMELLDANGNYLLGINTTERAEVWTDTGGYMLCVYRADLQSELASSTWNDVVDSDGAAIAAGLQAYTQLFTAQVTSAATPIYLSTNAAN